MDGDVKGACAERDDSLPVFGQEIGEGDVIALEEGQAPVIVTQVEGWTQARRHLPDKAKGAIVLAHPDSAHSALKGSALSFILFKLFSELPNFGCTLNKQRSLARCQSKL